MKLLLIFWVFATMLFANQTKKIVDSFGREVEVPNEVKKVIAINSSLRLIVYMQAQDLLIGVENIENRDQDRRPYTSAIKDRVKNLTTIGEGGPGKPLNIEALIASKPDVIFSSFFLNKDGLDELQKKTNIPVIGLSYFSSEGLGFNQEAFFRSLEIVGEVLDKKDRAKELISYIESLNSDLAQRSSKVKEKKRVYIGAVAFKGQHGITSSEAGFFPFDKVLAINVVDNLGKKGHLFLEKEKLLELKPDVIFIDGGGFELVKEDVSKNRAFYEMLEPFKKKELYKSLPNTFYGPNIEIMYANAYFIGSVLYPELYKDIDTTKKADEIIKAFVKNSSFETINKLYDAYKRVSFE